MDRDTELFLRFTKGDVAAFDELVRTWRTPLVRYMHRFIGDRDTAEELAQEVFVKLYTKAKGFEARPDASFKSYMFKVATNTGLNERRRICRRVLTVPMDRERDGEGGYDPEDRGQVPLDERQAGREALYALKRALAMLPERQAAALVMSSFHDMSHKEIGESLGISDKAVKSLLNRARDSLKRVLGPYLEDQRSRDGM